MTTRPKKLVKPKKPRRLIRSKDALPEWFPLAIYSADLKPEQWLEALVWRITAEDILNNTQSIERGRHVFESLIVGQEISAKGEAGLLSSDTHASRVWGVCELPAFEAAYLVTAVLGTERGRSLVASLNKIRKSKNTDALWSNPTHDIRQSRQESFGDLINWDTEPFEVFDVMSGFPVVVDLDQDDETLKLAFEVWLAGARDKLWPAPRPVNEKDFNDWKNYGILPAFDLYFWARLNNIKYSDTLVANAIWPDAEVDTAERLRKVTRPKLAEVVNWRLIRRFWRQLELMNALEALVKNRNAKS